MNKQNVVFVLLLCVTQSLFAQDVLTLQKGEKPGLGKITELSWLAGYYTGTGFGGNCDELWSPVLDNSMHGIFRYASNDSVQFSEYMIMEASEGTLNLKLKHFGRDLSPWEEKDIWTTFELIKIEGTIAYFNGITYAKNNDVLTIKLLLHDGEKSWVEEFVFKETSY